MQISVPHMRVPVGRCIHLLKLNLMNLVIVNVCALIYSVEGGELFDRVIDDEFILTEKTCTILVRQLCQAMEFVHSNNILHLDLKPENILCLTREGNRIKIIDFGLARRYDPEKKLQVS